MHMLFEPHSKAMTPEAQRIAIGATRGLTRESLPDYPNNLGATIAALERTAKERGWHMTISLVGDIPRWSVGFFTRQHMPKEIAHNYGDDLAQTACKTLLQALNLWDDSK